MTDSVFQASDIMGIWLNYPTLPGFFEYSDEIFTLIVIVSSAGGLTRGDGLVLSATMMPHRSN